MDRLTVKKQESSCSQWCLKNQLKNQHKFEQQRELLRQQIHFLTEELQEHRQRQQNNKKLNQSIIVTYQQTEDLREEHIVKSLKSMKDRHQQQIRKIKDIHYKQVKALEQNVIELTRKLDQQELQIEKKAIECEKKIILVRKQLENQNKKEILQKQNQIQVLTQKYKQAEGMADLYKQFMEKRRQQLEIENAYKKQTSNVQGSAQMRRSSCNYQQRYSRRSIIEQIKQNQGKDRVKLQVSRESVKQLTVKIDRALTQLKGSNNSKLYERINQKFSKVSLYS